VNKDLKQRYRALEALGCTVDWKRRHVLIERPDGSTYWSPSTSHNFHVLRNLDKEIKRLKERNDHAHLRVPEQPAVRRSGANHR
jgi:hypothetical protein